MEPERARCRGRLSAVARARRAVGRRGGRIRSTRPAPEAGPGHRPGPRGKLGSERGLSVALPARASAAAGEDPSAAGATRPRALAEGQARVEPERARCSRWIREGARNRASSIPAPAARTRWNAAKPARGGNRAGLLLTPCFRRGFHRRRCFRHLAAGPNPRRAASWRRPGCGSRSSSRARRR